MPFGAQRFDAISAGLGIELLFNQQFHTGAQGFTFRVRGEILPIAHLLHAGGQRRALRLQLAAVPCRQTAQQASGFAETRVGGAIHASVDCFG